MYNIKKQFGPYPFGHRQHKHDGHCALMHGHNWVFEIEFSSESLDSCGFVLDFGKMKELKFIFEDNFDHTWLVQVDDPELETLIGLEKKKMLKLVFVSSTSAEGVTDLVHDLTLKWLVRCGYNERVSISRVTVSEDHKNSAFV